MVWPIIRGKSYVGETGKSMKVGEMVVAQEDGWRKIAITLIDPVRPTNPLPHPLVRRATQAENFS
jgi:hypothetical protein